MKLQNDRGWVTFITDLDRARVVAEVHHHSGGGHSDGVDRVSLRGPMTADELRQIADWLDGEPLGQTAVVQLSSLLASERSPERRKALALAVAVTRSPAGFRRASRASKLAMIRRELDRV